MTPCKARQSPGFFYCAEKRPDTDRPQIDDIRRLTATQTREMFVVHAPVDCRESAEVLHIATGYKVAPLAELPPASFLGTTANRIRTY
jgi:hypothetical protein